MRLSPGKPGENQQVATEGGGEGEEEAEVEKGAETEKEGEAEETIEKLIGMDPSSERVNYRNPDQITSSLWHRRL